MLLFDRLTKLFEVCFCYDQVSFVDIVRYQHILFKQYFILERIRQQAHAYDKSFLVLVGLVIPKNTGISINVIS